MNEKNNQHKPGYKNTPLGWIPDEWEVKELGDCSLIKGEYGINAAAVEYSDQLPTYIRITDIDEDGNFKYTERKSVDNNAASNFVLEEYDIIFARTGATVGKTYLHKASNGKLVFAGFLIRFRTDKNKLLPYYLKYFTTTKRYWDWVKVVSMRSGQPGINSTEYCLLPIPLPTLPEQKKITTVLNTWDEAITKTQQLIAQLQQRNKGLMQQLLKPKENWKEKKLAEIFERVIRKNTTGNLNVVTISAQRGFVKQNDFFKKLVASDILDSYFLVRKGEFCYNKSYSNGYNWGATKRLNDFDEVVVTTLYICFKIREESLFLDDFFEYFFDSNLLDEGLAKIAHEGGRAHGLLNVTPTDFFNLKIQVPVFKEQKKIYSVLSTAKAELKLYQQQLDALQFQKKGLMQKLLTGEIRLKINNKN